MKHSAAELIKEKLSIVEVVGQYVELKAAGKSYKGKSPFTNEKTPSFYVSPERGMYYCFSSSQGGDMFTFVEKMEGVDFKGALKILADKAGVELVPEDPQKRDARETQYALLEEATQYFFKNREAAPQIDEYISNRGVKVATVHTWRIGYAKDEWRALKNHLKDKGYTDEQMLKAGLIKNADQGKEPYDVFRDRIMFPIFDSSGRVVAFSGRTLKSETGIPKYVNSPETELYQKSEILYGYDKAKNGIRTYDFSLIVEGQFDLVLSHQAGYTNTVAVSGTAFTKHHISLLLRLSKKAVLALDADRAGINAVKRSAVPMLEQGMDVKVAHMPEGQDPADVVRKDPHELKRIVGHASHVVEFLLQVLKEQTKDERTYKLRVREEIIPLLVAIDNRIDREHFEGVIATHIGATKDGVHFEVERLAEVAKNMAPKNGLQKSGIPLEAQPPIETGVKVSPQKHGLENHFRALLLVFTGERAWIGEKIKAELAAILGPEEMEVLLAHGSDAIQGEVFALEEQMAEVREKQLLEDMSHTLTHFSHLIARERLSRLRTLVNQADGDDKDDKILKILEQSKAMEQLLQKSIILTKE